MIREYVGSIATNWNHFWFDKREPSLLCLMRIPVGLMVLYTHLVWTLDLEAFFANQDGCLPEQHRALIFGSTNWTWSHFDWIGQSPTLLWGVHWMGLAIMLAFTLGWLTRITSALTALLVISYANRATGVQFGLDQINGFLCIYLALGRSGACYSLDSWIRLRRPDASNGAGQGGLSPDRLSNVALRLIQTHMCLVYLFAGLGKVQGETWWNGTAIWYAIASLEYQTLDLTWLANQMWLVNLMTLVVVAWEVSFAFLIWNRLARPVYLGLAVFVHLGIGLAMGMFTFGLIMLIGNLSFLDMDWLKQRIPSLN